MNSSRAFERLERTLVGRGVSRAYAARYGEELRDHWEDLIREMREEGVGETEAGRLAEERLGNAEELAATAVRRYRNGMLMGRHAWLFFGVMPVVSVPVGMFAMILAMVLPLVAMGVFKNGVTPEWRWELHGVVWMLAYGCPGLMGILYYRAARRRALGWGWRASVCAIAAGWGAWLRYTVSFATHGKSHGMFAVVFLLRPDLVQGIVAVVAIVLYAWLVERNARRRVSLLG